jgi:hypothetical protein
MLERDSTRTDAVNDFLRDIRQSATEVDAALVDIRDYLGIVVKVGQIGNIESRHRQVIDTLTDIRGHMQEIGQTLGRAEEYLAHQAEYATRLIELGARIDRLNAQVDRLASYYERAPETDIPLLKWILIAICALMTLLLWRLW